ncbi:MAG: HEAT repeat domain-containing protein, partial [Thermoguttaceae bacterium]
RRRAADSLSQLSAKQPLSRLAVLRLTKLVGAEEDALVWQGALRAVADNPSQQAVDLAYIAVGHRSAEVRRRACEHLAAHPDPAHQAILVPVLEDQSQAVVCAAARALGASGKMSDTQPLRRLLGSSNEEIQFAAASALAQLDDPKSKAALERLAYSKDPKIRAKAAQAMGEFPDPEFTAVLVRLLSDNLTVARAALQSLPKIVGKDVAKNADESPITTSEQMLRWKQWHQHKIGIRD